MVYVPSEYWVRVKVSGAGGMDAYHASQILAAKLASDNPGLTFEVSEDKVWASSRCDAPGGSNG